MQIKVDIYNRALGYEVPMGLSFNSRLCDTGYAKYFYDTIMKEIGVDTCPPKKVK